MLFHVFNAMFTRKKQGDSSNLFALCPKFSDFVPRASSALWIFPTARALDFLQPLDTPEKRFEFHINEQ